MINIILVVIVLGRTPSTCADPSQVYFNLSGILKWKKSKYSRKMFIYKKYAKDLSPNFSYSETISIRMFICSLKDKGSGFRKI